ncbi:substrate-binding domain-containing protein [Niallia taxi]|uniref:substrate-binding domain-containing protein n=1 Tax=Niallia taxi TaxID=2499688 RepID=UPI0020425732|nr:substrate-binding domain-containing protein [Niallia taxi]MCM3213596.1 substrate-binding domain-containing protein [Niallia taxi]MED4040745.1 substrate-binding domain-containing protein [Niallia taxi]
MELIPNENLYKEVLQTMSEYVIIQGKSGKTIALNNNAETVFGVKSDFFTESNFHKLEYIKEDGTPLPYSQLPGIITLQKGITIYNYVVGVIDPESGTKWVSINSKPLNMPKDGEQAALITISDITERKKMEQTIICAKEEAVNANLAKSDFLSKMSHELRTPLNGILGFAQLLEIDDSLNDEQRDFIQEIIGGGRHLLNLINDVLDLSRIDTGQLKVSIKEVDLHTIITECINIMQPLAKKKRIQIHNQLDQSQKMAVLADPIRLKQIFLNLLENSIKYNQEDGKVMIFSYLKRSNAVIHIADTGIGLSIEEYQKVFVPFYRTKETQEEGTGIGLSLVKQLVQLMGGKISVTSLKGIGSDFYFSLPLPYELKTAIQWEEEIMGLQTNNDKSDHYCLLYIEDNPSNLNLVKSILKSQSSYTILTAQSGKEGLELARKKKVDLILLDLNLPDIHGLELFKLLRTNEKTKDIAVIAVSANAMPQDIQQTLSMGFDNYVTKPVIVKEFLTTIYETLNSTINQNIPEHNILSTGPNGEEAVSAKTLHLSRKDLKKLREMHYTAAISMHYAGDNWGRAQIEGLETTFNKMGIRVVSVTDAQLNPDKQIADIQKILAKKPDILVSLPIDPLSTSEVYKTASQSGVKLVFIDNTPYGLEAGKDYISVVSADNYGNGVYAADIMAEKIGFKGKIGVLYYNADFFVTKQRLTAFEKKIRESYPDIQIITRSGFTNPNEGKELAGAMISQHLDLKGIFVDWDLVAEGAIASARALGRHDLVITTMDLGTNTALEIAKDGVIKGSGSQMPYHQGVAEAILAGYALLGKPAPAYVAVPALKVTKENLLKVWKFIYNRDSSN